MIGDQTERGNSPRLATVKFNFIAWAFRNTGRCKFGATDLMVLAQLVVRYDPARGSFAMSAEALAHRTGTAVSSVRRSLRYLERLGDLEVIARPGRSSLYKVRYERAPLDWIARERNDYEAKIGRVMQRRSLPTSGKGQGKILAGGAVKFDEAPSQDVSAVSISVRHQDSNISNSMRPDVRNGKEFAGAYKGKKSASLQTEQQSSFERFVDIWPKKDADLDKLKAAWHKRVVKSGVDPDQVIAMAEAWRRFYWSDPDSARFPFAGQWLAKEGWSDPPPRLSQEQESMADYFSLVHREYVRRFGEDSEARQAPNGAEDEYRD